MTNVFKKLFTISLFQCFCIISVFGQQYFDRQGIVRKNIISLVQSRYGSEYREIGYSIFDSLILYSRNDNSPKVQDPFKTLKGCILFSTYKVDHREDNLDTFVVGIIKNGKIIWDNYPGTYADLGGELLYAKDINNDGIVDLMLSETDRDFLLTARNPPFLSYLYVFSWDGKSGKCINSFRNDGKSALVGNQAYELVFKKDSKIPEILSTLPDIDIDWENYKTKTFPQIRYKWNGYLFGLYP